MRVEVGRIARGTKERRGKTEAKSQGQEKGKKARPQG